ncbi:FadR/GntR family transcriptional regulator [Microbacterium soli]|uniref:HTH gntR-type domain-containing protein n=1 Tax=Microbacterium soli TaxID=446075 RepID=A0ABP7MXZ2_9MICO
MANETVPTTLVEPLRASLALNGLGSTGSLPESIADVIERFIEQEAPAVGSLIGTKSELASVFQVAPSTLSEAMKILASRGAVRLRPGPRGGALVAEQRPVLKLARSMVRLTGGDNSISDVVDVRDALEEAVARDALRNRDSMDLERLHEHLDAIETASDATDVYRSVLTLHAAIAEAGANEFLKLVYLTAIRTLLRRTQKVSPSTPENDADALRVDRTAVHRALVEAIELQDEQLLRDVLDRHSTYRTA